MGTKQDESRHFKLFRTLSAADFPIGEVSHEDEPDFRVATSGARVGIEHRRVFKPSEKGKTPAQAEESMQRDIVGEAQEHAELNGLPGVHVSCSFRRFPQKERLNPREIGRALSLFVATNLPSRGESEMLTFDHPSAGETQVRPATRSQVD